MQLHVKVPSEYAATEDQRKKFIDVVLNWATEAKVKVTFIRIILTPFAVAGSNYGLVVATFNTAPAIATIMVLKLGLQVVDAKELYY